MSNPFPARPFFLSAALVTANAILILWGCFA